MAEYTVVGEGKDVLGTRWEVSVLGRGVCVDTGSLAVHVADVAGTLAGEPLRLRLDGDSLGEFAEAVARAQQLAQAAS